MYFLKTKNCLDCFFFVRFDWSISIHIALSELISHKLSEFSVNQEKQKLLEGTNKLKYIYLLKTAYKIRRWCGVGVTQPLSIRFSSRNIRVQCLYVIQHPPPNVDTHSMRKMFLYSFVWKRFTAVVRICEQLVNYRALSLWVFTLCLAAWRTRIYLSKNNFSKGLSWHSPPLFPASKSILQIKLMTKKIKEWATGVPTVRWVGS